MNKNLLNICIKFIYNNNLYNLLTLSFLSAFFWKKIDKPFFLENDSNLTISINCHKNSWVKFDKF